MHRAQIPPPLLQKAALLLRQMSPTSALWIVFALALIVVAGLGLLGIQIWLPWWLALLTCAFAFGMAWLDLRGHQRLSAIMLITFNYFSVLVVALSMVFSGDPYAAQRVFTWWAIGIGLAPLLLPARYSLPLLLFFVASTVFFYAIIQDYENVFLMLVLLAAVGGLITLTMQHLAAQYQAQQQLLEQERLYRLFFENAPFGLSRVRPDGTFIEMNPALARIMGYDNPAEMIANGISVTDRYVDPTRRAELLRIIEQQGYIQDFEAELYRADGQIITVMMAGRVLRGPDGRVQAIEGTLQDVTQRKQAEALRTEAARREEQIALIQRITRDAIHDLVTPLSAIYTQLHLLRYHHRSDGDLMERLARLESQVRQIQAAIERLKRLSSLGEGQPNRQVTPLIDKLTALVARQCELRGPQVAPLQLIVKRDPGPVLLDWIQVETALVQIIQNAYEHSGPDQPIRLVLDSSSEEIEIRVEDSGSGIEPADLPHIFEPFYRAQPRPVREGSLGLGLTLARLVVDQHHGQISASSTPGQGTSICIRIPIVSLQEPISTF